MEENVIISVKRDNKRDNSWQWLEDHLKNVAELAMGFADAFDAVEWGWEAISN